MNFRKNITSSLLVGLGYCFSLNLVSSFNWIKLNNHENIPPNAFVAGVEELDPLYVSKLYFDFEISAGEYPGKFKVNRCYITFYGREYSSGYGCEIMTNFTGKWIRISNPIPYNAVVGGRDEDFGNLYVGRVRVHDDVLVGKIQEEYEYIYDSKTLETIPVLCVAYKGKEILVKNNFEILVFDD